MLNTLIGRLTNNNEFKLSQIKPIVKQINSLEEDFKKLTDDEIKNKTRNWQNDLRSKKLSREEITTYLNGILPEAFALVREAASRAMNQRHRDVQLMAGITLHQGKIAEQKTGEGKTLTATLPLYLNSLAGKGAHLVTPNDYLSKHGAGWYGPVYEKLGVTVGVIVDRKGLKYDPDYLSPDSLDEYSRHLKPVSRVEAYKCDITYGTNSEYGFDYLRDNMAVDKSQIVQTNPNTEYGTHFFAIVDEVDSVLIDFARTPLIISQQKNESSDRYYKFAQLAAGLVMTTDYTVDEKDRIVTLTELGINKIERKLGVENLYEKDFETIHHIENALKAKELYEKDKAYVVQNGQIIIVDPNTGRMLQGNRWSDGLHQAIEAKEGLQIQAESKTVASISYQNYFRLYAKLAGMTGTALTESEEFYKIYSLDVVSIPTHKPVARVDKSDLIYKTEAGKFRAVSKEIAERHKKGQPVLIGTTSVEKSQLLSNLLKRQKVPHEILNAKQHEKEAVVIAQAGKKNSVTVATNMAGRGVDIILGGDPFDKKTYEEIVALGGLYVIGTERHDSRRVDNQLRGRSGRQGDPGESRFFLSMQDDLLRIFGGNTMEGVMNRLGVDENTPIESSIITKSIENAQKKVEGMNFDIRRALVDYDDVMNVQREAIYGMRRYILFSEDSYDEFEEWILNKVQTYIPDEFSEMWEKKKEKYGDVIWREVVKRVSMEVIDLLWMDHIDSMDDLRSGVNLRAYGQSDPLVEYKREGRERFERLLDEIWITIIDRLEKVEVEITQQIKEQLPLKKPDTNELDYAKSDYEPGVAQEAFIESDGNKPSANLARSVEKVGRNDPCPCGSGKKYKNCHGKL